MQTIDDQDRFLNQAGSLALKIYMEEELSGGKSLTISTGEGAAYDVAETMETARRELRKKAAKRAVCAALGSGSDDLKDVTKMAGAALLPLALTGVIALPILPVAFAAAGVVVFRMGVAVYCADVKQQESD